jgi:D-proline reductase (dithiol) PrdB
MSERRVALISTAALQHRDDNPMLIGAGDYRVIADDTPDKDLVMGHISTNFDRSGFEQDLNVVLPRDRLHEMAAAGEIGSVATYHYAFMGSTDPVGMEDAARALAGHLKADGVDTVFLLPV